MIDLSEEQTTVRTVYCTVCPFPKPNQMYSNVMTINSLCSGNVLVSNIRLLVIGFVVALQTSNENLQAAS